MIKQIGRLINPFRHLATIIVRRNSFMNYFDLFYRINLDDQLREILKTDDQYLPLTNLKEKWVHEDS